MPSDKHGGGAAHRGEVERQRHMPGLGAEQGVQGRVIPDEVAVLFARGIEARMKAGPRARGREHADVRRQIRVQGEGKFLHRHAEFSAGKLHMRHHAERMNAGVGAAGPMHATRLTEDFLQRLLHALLHAETGLLHLPARVVRPVVGDDEAELQQRHGRDHNGSVGRIRQF